MKSSIARGGTGYTIPAVGHAYAYETSIYVEQSEKSKFDIEFKDLCETLNIDVIYTGKIVENKKYIDYSLLNTRKNADWNKLFSKPWNVIPVSKELIHYTSSFNKNIMVTVKKLITDSHNDFTAKEQSIGYDVAQALYEKMQKKYKICKWNAFCKK